MNRRDYLRLLLAAPAFALPMLARARDNSARRVVLVELAGANDGLNTLVPARDDNYHRLRPTIALGASERIDITDSLSFHYALKPLMPLWESQQLAWVQGLGYPLPNRSHFKSIALWETSGDGNKQRRDGWLTHDIEHRLARSINDPHGISLVENLNLFKSNTGRWLSMTSPEQFLQLKGQQIGHVTEFNSSISSVRQQIEALEQSLYRISTKMESNPEVPSIPGSELGMQLQQVVRMIRAGLDTPVFRVQLSGFDTHEYQQYQHRSLLEQLASALAAFQRALSADGEWENTVVLTYSEFGRRAAENQSGGTDHGTAAPHLLMGGAIRGGIYGSSPNLEGLSASDDPEYTMDYRALYSAVLSDWLGIEDNTFVGYNDSRLSRLFS